MESADRHWATSLTCSGLTAKPPSCFSNGATSTKASYSYTVERVLSQASFNAPFAWSCSNWLFPCILTYSSPNLPVSAWGTRRIDTYLHNFFMFGAVRGVQPLLWECCTGVATAELAGWGWQEYHSSSNNREKKIWQQSCLEISVIVDRLAPRPVCLFKASNG